MTEDDKEFKILSKLIQIPVTVVFTSSVHCQELLSFQNMSSLTTVQTTQKQGAQWAVRLPGFMSLFFIFLLLRYTSDSQLD